MGVRLLLFMLHKAVVGDWARRGATQQMESGLATAFACVAVYILSNEQLGYKEPRGHQ